MIIYNIYMDWINNIIENKWINYNKELFNKNVANNLHLNWNYKNLSLNPNVTFDFIKSNLDKNWD